MKRIEDIKEFKDIDTYYEISEIVNEVFQDRVETHKHLVTANKEIERLHSIIKEVREYISNKKMFTYGEEKEFFLKDYWYGKELLEILDKVNKENI